MKQIKPGDLVYIKEGTYQADWMNAHDLPLGPYLVFFVTNEKYHNVLVFNGIRHENVIRGHLFFTENELEKECYDRI